MFDNLTDAEISAIDYKTFTGSIWYMHDLVLGTANHANFSVGDASQTRVLYFLYVFVTFTMLVHLTNMLIAQMGETFG